MEAAIILMAQIVFLLALILLAALLIKLVWIAVMDL